MLAAVAGHFGIPLGEVRQLRLWELRELLAEMRQQRRDVDSAFDDAVRKLGR